MNALPCISSPSCSGHELFKRTSYACMMIWLFLSTELVNTLGFQSILNLSVLRIRMPLSTNGALQEGMCCKEHRHIMRLFFFIKDMRDRRDINTHFPEWIVGSFKWSLTNLWTRHQNWIRRLQTHSLYQFLNTWYDITINLHFDYLVS